MAPVAVACADGMVPARAGKGDSGQSEVEQEAPAVTMTSPRRWEAGPEPVITGRDR
jgi:hypothetical protein